MKVQIRLNVIAAGKRGNMAASKIKYKIPLLIAIVVSFIIHISFAFYTPVSYFLKDLLSFSDKEIVYEMKLADLKPLPLFSASRKLQKTGKISSKKADSQVPEEKEEQIPANKSIEDSAKSENLPEYAANNHSEGTSADGIEQKMPVGEKLNYTFAWMGIEAGEGSVEVKEAEKGGKTFYHVIASGFTSDFVSMFYKASSRVESIINKENLLPVESIVVQRESRKLIDKKIDFDYENKKIIEEISDLKKQKVEKNSIDLNSQVFDSISVFYYFRNLPLKVGDHYSFNVYAGKKIYTLEVDVLRKEEIELPQGKLNTIVVKPVAKFNGKNKNKGDLYIWLTDDDVKTPVLMKSTIKIGELVATLKDSNI